MTRQRWTTNVQRNWLHERIPKFQEAQENGKTTDFYDQVYKEWAGLFETPAPTADEISAAGSAEAAAREKRKALEKRIFQWFHNNTRPTTWALKDSVIPIMKPTKIPAPWQTYLKLYYDTKLKTIIDAEYVTAAKDGEKVKSRIQIQSEVSRREYEKESDEVKAEVEAYRKNLMTEDEPGESQEKQAQKFQYGVDRVQKTLFTYMKALEAATGWSFCVFAGGPNPRQEGKINRILYETNHPDLTLEETIGESEWNAILAKWNDYLHTIFSEEVRKQRSCSSLPIDAPEGEAQPNAETQTDDEQEIAAIAVGKKNVKKVDTNKNKGKLVSSTFTSPKSEYAIQRELNMSANKELLLEVVGKDLWEKEKPQKGGKGKKKRSKKNQIAAAAAPDDSASSASSQPLNADKSNCLPVDINTSAEGVPTSASIHPTEEDAIQKDEPGVIVQETVSTSIDIPMDGASSLIPLIVPTEEKEGQEHAAATQETVAGPAAQMDTDSIIATSAIETAPSGNLPFSESDNAAPDATSSNVPSVDLSSISATGYINDEVNLERLLDMCTASNWKNLLENWAVFEKHHPNAGPLSTKQRPTEIAMWMKNGRKLNRHPKIIKLADFIVSWRRWWLSLQPEWRVQDDAWPPSRDMPTGHNWLKIAYTGWWGKLVASGFGDLTELETAIDDVLWVLCKIVEDLSVTPAKRTRSDDETDTADQPVPKRMRND